MNDKLFNIDFKRLAVWWIPTFRRKERFLNFAFVLINPLEKMFIEVLKARKENLIRVNFNYQKFSLQRRLNEAFDPLLKRIRIVNAIQYEGLFTYNKAEIDADNHFDPKRKWLETDNPLFLRLRSELTSEYDFIVEIPNTNINQIQLKAEIDYYILPSKSYLIKII